jgi:hypothetical protein
MGDKIPLGAAMNKGLTTRRILPRPAPSASKNPLRLIIVGEPNPLAARRA